MPSIPLLGTDGSSFDPAHANLYDVSYSATHQLSYDGHLDSRGIGDSKNFNASMILAASQQHVIQVVATCTSSISLIAAVCAVYWFCMMRRNFRRDLVLLLIAGGSWKSLWFVVFSAQTFIGGTIETNTSFCQGSGYMLQVGFEMCDAAVLFMSMHMHLQIFPPKRLTFFGHEGLYHVRRWVVAAWLLLPNLSAALAFVNPDSPYMAQGGFCSLPLRPMWYRLALFWIPRYLVWVYVVFVAIAITRYVGSEFKVFGQERDSSTSQCMPSASTKDDGAPDTEKGAGRSQSQQLLGSIAAVEEDDARDCAPDDVDSVHKARPRKISPPELTQSLYVDPSRRPSLPSWAVDVAASDTASNPFASQSKSTPTSRRGSRQVKDGFLSEDFAAPSNFDVSTHRTSVTSVASARSTGAVSFDGQPALPPIREGQPASASSNGPKHSANRALRMRRCAIQRQLRLLFIYPCIYMILWIIPFVVNCMNYFDYWAQHPIFALKVIQISCMTIMTFVDVFVFCWRERPWRHIPGSDGTFVGSFMWWRFCFGGAWSQERRMSRVPSFMPRADEVDDETVGSGETGLFAKLKDWTMRRKQPSSRGSDTSTAPAASSSRPRPKVNPHMRTFSGGSDRRHLEVERAHERLALERAEYEQNRRSLQERRASVISGQQQSASPAVKKERKDWFDDA